MNCLYASFLKIRRRPHSSDEAGLTLIEVTAAIVLVAIALAATLPPLALSAASRIQNRRIQQADALARREIDRVSALLSRTTGVPVAVEQGLLPPEAPIAVGETTVADPNSAPAPTTIVNARNQLNLATEALAVDINANGETDFCIQLARNSGVRFTVGARAGQLAVFDMVVRVYEATACDNPVNLLTEPVPVRLTSAVAAARTQPLTVLRATIAQSDSSLSLREVRNYICDRDDSLAACP